jgi:hypothetical protein
MVLIRYYVVHWGGRLDAPSQITKIKALKKEREQEHDLAMKNKDA